MKNFIRSLLFIIPAFLLTTTPARAEEEEPVKKPEKETEQLISKDANDTIAYNAVNAFWKAVKSASSHKIKSKMSSSFFSFDVLMGTSNRSETVDFYVDNPIIDYSGIDIIKVNMLGNKAFMVVAYTVVVVPSLFTDPTENPAVIEPHMFVFQNRGTVKKPVWILVNDADLTTDAFSEE